MGCSVVDDLRKLNKNTYILKVMHLIFKSQNCSFYHSEAVTFKFYNICSYNTS